MKQTIRQWAIDAGASRCGFAQARAVSDSQIAAYEHWLSRGNSGDMQYCQRYREQRNDPRLLLEGARTLISCAFCYNAAATSPYISRYALGQDYHYAIKARLGSVADKICSAYGGACRVCVDTAPLRERYWAQQAGVGFIGINNQLIVPGLGSYFFLGEILWTGAIEPDEPCCDSCGECMECVKACPGSALDGNGCCDASRCLSYLTIEHRGALPADPPLGDAIYGCDACQACCPHNANAPISAIAEFQPDPEILALTPQSLSEMTPSHYKRLTRCSAMRRAPLAQLLRNIHPNP